MRQVVIYPGEDGHWVAECPSLPGCNRQGETREQAMANIKEAIQGYVKALEEDGLPVLNERFETSWSRYEPVARHLWPGVCQGLGKNVLSF